MRGYTELKGIEVPESVEEWREIEEVSLADLIKLPANVVGKAKATLYDSRSVQTGHLLYDLMSPRMEVDHYFEDDSMFPIIKKFMEKSIGKEVIIGGYHPKYSRFNVHYLNIGGNEFLS